MLLRTNNAEVIRETNRVFAYQPGKSLLIMNTFAMEPPKANLRQRVGYCSAEKHENKYREIKKQLTDNNVYLANVTNEP